MNENEKMEINPQDIGTAEMPEMEMNEFFQNHFIRIDGKNRIVRGFSDVPEFHNPPPQDGETDILINDKGGRHFRLFLDGEPTHENPWELMLDEHNVPLLKWDGKAKKIVRRTGNEIRADIEAMPTPEPAIPVEERIKHLEKTAEYHEKVIEVLMETMPKPQKAQIAQFQKAMLGASNG